MGENHEPLTLDGKDDGTVSGGGVCLSCHHLASMGAKTCAAFPGGIPDAIWRGGDPHAEPRPDLGQENAVVYEPFTAEEMAEAERQE